MIPVTIHSPGVLVSVGIVNLLPRSCTGEVQNQELGYLDLDKSAELMNIAAHHLPICFHSILYGVFF